jgi:hypothetical protein
MRFHTTSRYCCLPHKRNVAMSAPRLHTKPTCRCRPRSSMSRPTNSTGAAKDIYARRGRRRIKTADKAWRHNKQEGRTIVYASGRGVHLLCAASQRAVPWGGRGSGRRGSHIWHQSKARMTQGPGGRRVAAAGRRRDG